MLTRSNHVLLYGIPILFLIIYFQIFSGDFAYLDEAYALWHNDDKTNYNATQGRWLSGLIFQFFFSSISRIAELKWLRLVSWAGWIITSLAWTHIFRKWVHWLGLPKEMEWIAPVFVVCSISVGINIGWAACMEIFLGVLAGLVSGHILFACLHNQKDKIQLPNTTILCSLFLGVISLSIYQSSYGVFLIPFFLHYMLGKKIKPDKIVIIAVGLYLVTFVVYYFLFTYSLKLYHLQASNRTEIHVNVLKKISFFFSGPLPQGFSLNLLFSASSIFSQIFYVLVFGSWIILVFRRNKRRGIRDNILYICFILFLLALVYLPSMVAAENFPPYRTLFAFNLAVFILVVDNFLFVLQRQRQRRIFVWSVSSWLLVTGFYNFNFQFVNPLRKEYKILRTFVEARYRPGVRDVYFVRADKFLFANQFHTRVYRDEFGAPSTYRDWVPEPITKQLIFEITNSRTMADRINVIQFENLGLFTKSKPVLDSNSLFIDMNELFYSKND